jgi:hypothetical protein
VDIRGARLLRSYAVSRRKTNRDDDLPNESSTTRLSESDYPSTCAAAQELSRSAQRRFIRLMQWLVGVSLVALVIGQVATLTQNQQWLGFDMARSLGIAATAAGGVVVALHLVRRDSDVETIWYRSRAGAESMKGLTWRYAVCAQPFDVPNAEPGEVDGLFLGELAKIAEDIPDLVPVDGRAEITEAMRALRSEPLAARKAIYMRDRVSDQQMWYARRSRRFAMLSRRLDELFYALAGAAIVFGVLLAALQDNSFASLVSVAAGAVGSVLTWQGVRRYSMLSRTYARSATELSLKSGLAANLDTPTEWATFVDSVEELLGREHAQWRASRT